MKTKFRLADALVGLLLTAVVAAAFFRMPVPGAGWVIGLSLKVFDSMAQLRANIDPSPEIVIVEIDDAALSGRPGGYPRAELARLVSALDMAGPRVIGLGVYLEESSQTSALAELEGLRDRYAALVAQKRILDRGGALESEFALAKIRLDSDSQLLTALATAQAQIVVPIAYGAAADSGTSAALAAALERSSVRAAASEASGAGGVLAAAGFAQRATPALVAAAARLGHATVLPGPDGVVRSLPPILRDGSFIVPAFSLQVAAAYLGVPRDGLIVVPGREVRAGPLTVPLGEAGDMLITFAGDARSFRYHSANDVLDGRVPADVFRDKIVLVGYTAAAAQSGVPTPGSTNLPAVEVAANAVENMLNRRFLSRPEWARNAELGALAAAAVLVLILLPVMRATSGLALTLVFSGVVLAASAYCFKERSEVVRGAYPAILALAGFLGLGVRRLLWGGSSPEDTLRPAAPAASAAPVEAASGSAQAPQAVAAAADAAGGLRKKLGRYEIERELGRGAMGIVYLGKDPKINRAVAIKTLMLDEDTAPSEVKEIKERFFREAESAGTLNHPGIVRIFDAGEDQGVCYIAMELLDGEDMTQATKKTGRLPIAEAVAAVATAADALDYAHGQGIVHRDIKPANMMRLKDGSIRVTDFGIARITASSKTATGTVMGTPSYMSPEQIAGKKVDGRSDLFSLGVTLFEFVCGEKPFKGGDGIGTLLYQIANEPAPDPCAVNPDLPQALAAVINRALRKNPDERFQTAAEFAAALRASLTAPSPAPAVEEARLEDSQPVDAEPAPQAEEPSAQEFAAEPEQALEGIQAAPEAAAEEAVTAAPSDGIDTVPAELGQTEPEQDGPFAIRDSDFPKMSGETGGFSSLTLQPGEVDLAPGGQAPADPEPLSAGATLDGLSIELGTREFSGGGEDIPLDSAVEQPAWRPETSFETTEAFAAEPHSADIGMSDAGPSIVLTGLPTAGEVAETLPTPEDAPGAEPGERT